MHQWIDLKKPGGYFEKGTHTVELCKTFIGEANGGESEADTYAYSSNGEEAKETQQQYK